MDRPSEPWRDYEKRDLLCNIIRASNVPPEELWSFIAQHHIDPLWDNVSLPSGRPLAECRRTFDSFYGRRPYQMQAAPYGPPQYPVAPTPFGGAPTRGVARFDPQTTGGRVLLPKTAPSTPSEAGPAYPQSPLAEQQPARKRGRPPKEEVSRRKAEAEARGEVYPLPRTKRPKRPPQAQEAPSPFSMTPLGASIPAPSLSTPTAAGPAETGSESSGSKRRRLQRPADIEIAGTRPPRDPATASYESPPQTGLTPAQPSASTASGTHDTDLRMEGMEEAAPSARAAQSYREIVGIRGTSSG